MVHSAVYRISTVLESCWSKEYKGKAKKAKATNGVLDDAQNTCEKSSRKRIPRVKIDTNVWLNEYPSNDENGHKGHEKREGIMNVAE